MKLATVLALVYCLAIFVCWELSARIRGQLVARFDLARGHYEVLSLGLAAPWRPEYARLLHERYGIELRVVAGCDVSEWFLAYVEGYNTESMSAVNRELGRDVFRESVVEASRNWRLRRPATKRRE
jgi:hypothetical protein